MSNLAQRLTRAAVAVVLALSLTSGCGPSTVPVTGETVDVTGTVTLADGKPLKNGMIRFESDGPPVRSDAAAITDGAFKSKMFVAKYKVYIDVDPKKVPVPVKYLTIATSDLQADIKSGMSPLVYELK